MSLTDQIAMTLTGDIAPPPGLSGQNVGLPEGLAYDLAPPPGLALAKAFRPPPGLRRGKLDGKAGSPESEDESKADTSIGSTSSDDGTFSDGEQSEHFSEDASPNAELRADAPLFMPGALRADAAEFVPTVGMRSEAPAFVPMNAEARTFVPMAPTVARTKVSKDALPFVPQSVRSAISLQQAAYTTPKPPPGLRTKLSSKAVPFVRPPPGSTNLHGVGAVAGAGAGAQTEGPLAR